MKELKFSWQEFDNKYKPQQNHIDPNASYGDSWGYETYGSELEYVKSIVETEPNRVWTVLDTDGAMIIGNGFHHVNRMAYIITELPFADDENISIVDREDEEQYLLGLTVVDKDGKIFYQQLNSGGLEGLHAELVEQGTINEDEVSSSEVREWLTKNGYTCQFPPQYKVKILHDDKEPEVKDCADMEDVENWGRACEHMMLDFEIYDYETGQLIA